MKRSFWRSVLLVVGVSAAGAWTFNRRRVKTLQKERSNYGRGDFLADCQRRGLPPDVAAVTWDWFMAYLGRSQFPVRLDDTLSSTNLGIVEDDLDDSVLEIARRCGRRAPTTREVLRRPPVRTIADLIALVGSTPVRGQ